jgi:V/A-type H+-transporting ATPase subunit F
LDYFFIGDAELVTAFRFIGIEGKAVKDSEHAVSVFRQITEGWNTQAGAVLPDSIPGAGDPGVLILSEETADWLGDILIDWQISGRYPLIVEIPGILGHLPGRRTLVDSIRQAIGVHI